MNKTRLISIMLLAMLLTSCAAAVVGDLQGKYDNEPPPTPEQQSQGNLCALVLIVVITALTILSRGNGARAIVFSIIGVAIGICFLLA